MLFFRIILAVIVRLFSFSFGCKVWNRKAYLAVSAIGKPSGMKAIATETISTMSIGTLIQSGCDFRMYAALVALLTQTT